MPISWKTLQRTLWDWSETIGQVAVWITVLLGIAVLLAWQHWFPAPDCAALLILT